MVRKPLLLLCVTMVLLAAASARCAERKPNFLFVYTDDMRWDAVGVVQREQGDKGRFPWFKTPSMDRLAAEGVRFRNAFVTLPLCAPSRASFMTGRYNHVNGVANNHTPFPESSVTHASLLGSAGYATAYIGKWHMDGQRGKRPTFGYSASFIGQGKYWDCPFEIDGVPTQTRGWVDDVSTSYAIEFMTRNREKPFSVIVGFKACHGPNEPPERAKDRFAGETARPVPNLDVRPIYRDSDTTPVKKGAINLNYFRCVSAADDNLGLLLKTLDDLDLADDTVVVFTSDNGYYLREHQLSDKRSLYEESLRIPLLVRYPKRFPKGKAIDGMALNIDIAPTFLDLAGVGIPKEMQGRSLLPLAAGKREGWRKSFLSQYFFEAGFATTPSTVAVRTEDAKLIKYPGHDEWTELFDLKKDPYETKNLADDPGRKDLRTRMEKEFEQQVDATDYAVPAYADPANTDAPQGRNKPARKNPNPRRARQANRP